MAQFLANTMRGVLQILNALNFIQIDEARSLELNITKCGQATMSDLLQLSVKSLALNAEEASFL